MWGPTPAVTSCVGVAIQDCPCWHLILPACGARCLANLAAGQPSICSRTDLRELSYLTGKEHGNPNKGTLLREAAKHWDLSCWMTLVTLRCVLLAPLPGLQPSNLPAQNPHKHSTAAIQGVNQIFFYVSLSKWTQIVAAQFSLYKTFSELHWHGFFFKSKLASLGLRWQ